MNRQAPFFPDSLPTVLIVEDDDLLRELLAEVVGELGANVYTACSADAGLTEFHAHPELALIITDVVTPGTLNGWDLALQVYEESPGLPVIVTSGYCLQHKDSLPDSACFLRKPWSLDEMCQLVSIRLEGKD